MHQNSAKCAVSLAPILYPTIQLRVDFMPAYTDPPCEVLTAEVPHSTPDMRFRPRSSGSEASLTPFWVLLAFPVVNEVHPPLPFVQTAQKFGLLPEVRR